MNTFKEYANEKTKIEGPNDEFDGNSMDLITKDGEVFSFLIDNNGEAF